MNSNKGLEIGKSPYRQGRKYWNGNAYIGSAGISGLNKSPMIALSELTGQPLPHI
jgi:hypothetical protein